MTHNAVSVTTVSDGATVPIVSNNSYIKNAKEVLVSFPSNPRVGQIHLIRSVDSSTQVGTSAYITGTPYYIAVTVNCNFVNGNLTLGCSVNTWGVTSVPVKIDANTVRYR